MEAPSARLWTVQQAASYLGVRPAWVYEAVRGKRLAHYRLGRHLRFRTDDLDAFVAEQRVPARA